MALTPYTAAYKGLKTLKGKADQTKFTGEKPSMLLYAGVGMIAILKDVLDLAIGLIPGVVTVVAFCLTFLIWMILFLFDRSGGRSNRKMTQGIILIAVGIFEGIGIGFDYLPVETLSIVLLYILAKRAYEKGQKLGMTQTQKQTKEERIAIQRAEMAEEAQMEVEAQAAQQTETQKKDIDMRHSA